MYKFTFFFGIFGKFVILRDFFRLGNFFFFIDLGEFGFLLSFLMVLVCLVVLGGFGNFGMLGFFLLFGKEVKFIRKRLGKKRFICLGVGV